MKTLKINLFISIMVIGNLLFAQCPPIDQNACESLKKTVAQYEGTMGGPGEKAQGDLIICEACELLKVAVCSAKYCKDETQKANVQALINQAFDRMDNGSLMGSTRTCPYLEEARKPCWGCKL